VEACGPEILLIASWTLHVEKLTGKMSIWFPYSVVKTWLEAGEPADETAGGEPRPARPDGLSHALAEAPVKLAVRLSDNPIRMSDFVNLQEGDCLQLNHLTQEPVGIYINGCLKFQGHLGVRGRQLAVQISALAESKPKGAKASSQK